MADGVVEPWSVDPAFTHKVPGELTSPLISPIQFGIAAGDSYKRGGWVQVFTQAQVRVLSSDPFLGGFIAQTGDAPTPGRILAVGMLRFADAAVTRRVVDALIPTQLPLPSGFPTIDGVRALDSAGGPDKQSFAAVAQRGDLLLIAHARAGAKEFAADLVSKALAAQVMKASQYKATPYDGIPPLEVPMDRDGIVSRTLPGRGENPDNVTIGISPNNSPYYGYHTPYAKALALPAGRDSWNGDVSKYGVDLESLLDSNLVQRMRDSASARQKLLDKYPEPSGRAKIPGLASDVARCGKAAVGDKYSCAVHRGRYFAETITPTLDLARQAVSAQYLILQAAG